MAEKEFTVSSLDREELLALFRKGHVFLPRYHDLLFVKWELASARAVEAHRRAGELMAAESAAFDAAMAAHRKGSAKAVFNANQAHMTARIATEKVERAARRAGAEADLLWKLLDACDHLRHAQMGGEDHG